MRKTKSLTFAIDPDWQSGEGNGEGSGEEGDSNQSELDQDRSRKVELSITVLPIIVIDINDPNSFLLQALVPGQQRYWAFEGVHWSHRLTRYIWVQGSVPPGDESVTPLVLDWNKNDIDPEDDTTWPPANTFLSDLVIWKVISSEISVRSRYNRWPKVFRSGGMVFMTRPNMGPAANTMYSGQVRDLVLMQSYILHGDSGAQLLGGTESHRTGKPTRVWIGENGERKSWTVWLDEVSAYPITTGRGYHFPMLMPLASFKDGCLQ